MPTRIIMPLLRRLTFVLLIAAGMTFSAHTALAGPPLLCHPILIGDAHSLPSGNDQFGIDMRYDREQLIPETLALLTPDMPILTRMETLRRATLYATRNLAGARSGGSYTERDKRIAAELLTALKARIPADTANTRLQALALFDFGYLAACYAQARIEDDFASKVIISDILALFQLDKQSKAYDIVRKACRLYGPSAEMEFACALLTLHPRRDEQLADHLRNARAAAPQESLLAVNLHKHFTDE